MTDTTKTLSDEEAAKELLRAARIWARGCTNDGFGAGLGACPECNEGFLRHVGKTIGVRVSVEVPSLTQEQP